ncbi:hypothetical protein N2152v2_009758 [Parachlorella kessleri]
MTLSKHSSPKQTAAQVAVLLASNRRRALGVVVLAAAGGYLAVQHGVLFRKQPRGRGSCKSEAGGVAGESSQADKQQQPQRRSSGGRRGGTGAALKEMLPLLLRVAGRKVLVIVLLAVARTTLSNRLARLQGYLFRAAFLRRVPLFMRNLAENILLCAVAAGLESTSRSWVSYMDLQWRRLLTARMHKAYFTDMTYYKLSYVDRRIEQPEQRVCEDVPKLCTGLADLTRECLTAVVDTVFYAYQLRRYSGTNAYTAAILGYVFGAGTLMTVAAPNFGGLFKKQQALEGAYRHLQTRLRANAESVAFYGGIAKEGGLVRGRFREVLRHQAKLLGKQWTFGMVQDFLLKYLGATVAVALIIGPFFGGSLRPENSVQGRAQMLSNMRYHTSVIISLFGALGTLGAASRKLMKLGAYADRVKEMERVMRDCAQGTATGKMGEAQGQLLEREDAISFEEAVVVTPGNNVLVEGLSLEVAQGTNLLVTGPNGAGKSSLFRVLGGLWPLTCGRIYKPGGGESGLCQEIFYVPQRPYVTVGTLQEQIIYPYPPDSEHRIPEGELRALLRRVDLEYLVDRSGGGGEGEEEVTNWGEALSLGEQQRLGMARLFFHRPRFAILDECTSGVTVDMEERFCEMVKDMGCTCITISHRPALMAFHDLVLNLDGEGGWAIHPGHRSAAKALTALAAEDGPLAGAKVRGSEAAAVLQGMMATPAPALVPNGEEGPTSPSPSHHHQQQQQQLGQGEEQLGDGNEGFSELVVARSPPATEASRRAALSWAPALALKPSRPTLLGPWKRVLGVLLGGDVRQNVMRVSAVAGVVVLRTLLQDRIASLNGRSVDLVLRQELGAFIRLIGVSVAQSVASAVLAPSLRQVADMLALNWRSRLTRAACDKYLAGNTFYTASQLGGMQDIDQRLTRDVERLCDDLAALIPTLVKPVVDVAWFSWQLWRLTGRRGAVILYAYVVLGYTSLRAVTPDFSGLLKREYALEGRFRNAHSRLRTHAESVAFFGGGEKEGSQISAAFSSLTAHLRSVIGHRWSYGAADEFFAKQLPHNVTWLLTLLFALEARGDFGSTAFQGALVHDMRYLASVVTQTFSACGELLAMPNKLAQISGGVARVSEMLEVLDKSAAMAATTSRLPAAGIPGSPLRSAEQEAIEFAGVDVITPGGRLLARRLSLQVAPGRSLLVTGPNGCGKTSLFRLLGGLWPLPDGRIHKPGKRTEALDTKDIFYVPQKPYTTIGSLREQLIYPLSLEQALAGVSVVELGENGSVPSAAAELDRQLCELMGVVRLGYLLDREGGWEAAQEWGEVLSLGEQQRVGMARLFFHRPRFGVLDECTNATSVEVEEHLYKHAASLGITLVTITQRTALVKYHQLELRLNGQGDWELREIHKCQQQQQQQQGHRAGGVAASP